VARNYKHIYIYIQWLAIVKSCGFKRSALVRDYAWKIFFAFWSWVPLSGLFQEGSSLPLLYTNQPNTADKLRTLSLSCF
jgi:hypothetical protein